MAQTDAMRPYQPAAPTQLGEDRRYLRNELDKLSASISSVRAVMQELEATLNTDTANIATNTTGIAANTSALAKITGNPAMDIRLTVDQTATDGVWNQVQFNSVIADVYSGWNSSTHRYIPPAGVYLFIGSGYFNVATASDGGVAIVSNGSTFEQLASFQLNASGSFQPCIGQVSVVLAVNGTTSFEVQCLVSGSVPKILSPWTRFQVIRLA